MKKIIIMLLGFLLLCGCEKPQSEFRSKEKLNIVTSVFPLYDFVRAVGGERVDITLLIDPGTEVHSYEPTPSDIKAVYNADLFVYIGGESDSWALKILSDVNVSSLTMLSSVELLESGYHQGHDRSENHNHLHEYDEHIWTSPSNAILMLEKICDTLIKIDADGEEYYKKQCREYTGEITGVLSELRTVVEKSNGFMIIADRFPFKYFTEELGISYKAALGSCASSSDISIKAMSELLEGYEKHSCKSAFYCEMSNKTIANALAEQTGAKLYELHSAHNVTKQDFNSGVTYVDIMKRNVTALERGLN